MDFIEELSTAASECLNLNITEIRPLIEIPPEPSMGNFALPCFKLAAKLKKPLPEVTGLLSGGIKLPRGFERAEVKGAYVNFFLDRVEYASSIINEIARDQNRYGGSTEGNGRNICIDYSSINIAKPFHIGHLSSTVIGHSLYRIYEHFGYNSVGINHLGDWGTQFGKLIVAYKRWGDKDTVDNGKVRALLELYVKFHDEAEKDESLNDEARAWFKRIEDGDTEALLIFEWFKELTLIEVGRIYDMLGISFDSYAGESFYNDKMDEVVELLHEKQLLVEDDGANIVDLTDFKMPPCIILRSDGATLYATRDLAAALYRKRTYDFEKSLYVVAYQQDLHFRQLFKVLELMGFDWASSLTHVSFGMVSIKDGTLSTRKGNVLFLEDALNAAVEKALAIMEEKSPDLPDKLTAAQQVGTGALIFNTLYNNRRKDVVFSYDDALNYEGETGPYVQYTHARCCSLLRNANISEMPADVDFSVLGDELSGSVIRALAAFKITLREAMNKNEPYMVSRATMAIAKEFNKFYYSSRIIGEQPHIENARLALTFAVKSVIATGLYLIGMAAPEKM